MTKATSHERELARISATLAEIGFALPGSLVSRTTEYFQVSVITTRCGKIGCRCQADSPVPHGPYLSSSRAVNGQTITRAISPE